MRWLPATGWSAPSPPTRASRWRTPRSPWRGPRWATTIAPRPPPAPRSSGRRRCPARTGCRSRARIARWPGSGSRRSRSTRRCSASSPTTSSTACGSPTRRWRRARRRRRWRRSTRCGPPRPADRSIRASISPTPPPQKRSRTSPGCSPRRVPPGRGDRHRARACWWPARSCSRAPPRSGAATASGRSRCTRRRARRSSRPATRAASRAR